MKQYLDLCRRIVNEGEWVANERTGKRCLTVINADLEYDVANNQFPLITTRKSYWKAAIAEFLGYIRGYDNAADFRKLGTKTWQAKRHFHWHLHPMFWCQACGSQRRYHNHGYNLKIPQSLLSNSFFAW